MVAQAVRVKVAGLAVPAKNCPLQRIELGLGELERGELLLDLVQELGMGQDRPEQLAGVSDFGPGDQRGQPARADAGRSRGPARRPAAARRRGS